MFPCLPAPRVFTSGPHAYCLPSDCLQHHLSFGYKVAFFDSLHTPGEYSHPKYSPRGIEIASGNPHSKAVAAIMWSDDCDPQNSKKHRKALWCLTITFIQDTDVTSDSPIPTYPLAVGPKGMDHRKIQKIIFDDLSRHSSTNRPFLSYSGKGKNILPITLDVFAYLGDQPERRGVNYLMLGGSTHHARWRYCCNVGAMVDVLRACCACEKRFLHYVTSHEEIDISDMMEHCTTCTNWWLSEDHPLLTYKAPPKYPKDVLLGGMQRSNTDDIPKGWLRPIQLSYPILCKVIKMAHDNIVSRKWTLSTAKCFLNTNCINTALIEEILEKADNCLQYNMSTAEHVDAATREAFFAEKQARPKAFQMAELPPVFHSGMDLDTFVDPPLHLVALGFMNTTIKLIDSWIGARERKQQFLRLVRPALYHIKNMDLDWCEVVPNKFGGSYGGYISDNYMAIGRLSPWLYSPILSIPEPEPYVEPDKPVDSWVVKECRGYLSIRGIKIPRYVAQMRASIKKDKTKTKGAGSAILTVPTCTGEEVFECVIRLFLLVCHLYYEGTESNASSIHLHIQIRLYLSSFDRLDLATRTSRKSPPRWVSAPNFMCILNIPGMVERFGAYKSLYEGKYSGEGYNRVLKPCANRTSHRNRSTNLMRNLIREKSMEAVQTNFDSDDTINDEPITNKSLIYRMAHRYKNKNKVRVHYNKHLPLSVLVFNEHNNEDSEHSYGCCYIFQKNIYVSLIGRIDATECLVGGSVQYYKWILSHNVAHPLEIESVRIVGYGILLPLVIDPVTVGLDSAHSYYTISTHSWNKEGNVGYDNS